MVLLAVAAVATLSLYLTPERLARIASEYASRSLDADLRLKGAEFTFWSTFPHFEFSADSITVVSRRLRGITAAQRASLPADCDTLARVASVSGSFNPVRLLLHNRISVRRLNVDGLWLNLVALNDSVDNYDIIPMARSRKPFVMPRFDAGAVSFTNPRGLRYYSALTQASVDVALRDARLLEKGRDRYSLQIGGNVNLSVQRLRLLSGFPFRMWGDVDIAFRPFAVKFSRYNVNLGNLSSQVDLNMKLGENNSRVTDFRYDISPFELMRLFEYLPSDWLPALRGLRSDMTLEASARLTAPYRFSSSVLPSFEVDFRVPDSWLTYTVEDGSTFRARSIGMEAHLDFNGADIDASRFTVGNLSLEGEGARVALRGHVDNIFSAPRAEAVVTADADLGRLARRFPLPAGTAVSGTVSTEIASSFPVSVLADGDYTSIPVAGRGEVRGLRLTQRSTGLDLRLPSARFAFSEKERGGGTARLGLTAAIDTVSMSVAGYSAAAASLTVQAAATVDDAGIDVEAPADIALRVGRGTLRADVDTMTLDGEDVAISGTLTGLRLDAGIAVGRLRYSDPVNFALLHSVSTDVSLDPAEYPGAVPGTALALITVLRPSGMMHSSGGRFVSIAYPALTEVGPLQLAFSPGNIRVDSLSLRSQQNAFSLRGSMLNYNTLMAGHMPQGVQVLVDLRVDTLNINEIAGTYRAGQNLLALRRGRTPAPGPEGEDTAARRPSLPMRPMTIPPWISAKVHVSADECTYTNLRLLGLNADMRVADGIFTLDTIFLHTDFGAAGASATYDGRDSLGLRVGVGIDIDSINVVTFFRKFHKLLEMMPQMRNLSGYLSARVKGDFLVFPTMVMNMPSLAADLHVEGDDLRVRQNHFIHRLARYLLIRGHNDLHIHDIRLHAAVRDNMVELYPFIFGMDRYRLSIAGENDFAGNLYYHIGVLDSPVPFRFGVNLEGTFDKVDIRFGGPRFDADRAFRRMSLLSDRDVNIITELKWLVRLFISKAVKADGAPHINMLRAASRGPAPVHDRLLTGEVPSSLMLYKKQLRDDELGIKDDVGGVIAAGRQ